MTIDFDKTDALIKSANQRFFEVNTFCVMFVCWSLTPRKGCNISIYWIIVRVLLSSRPYQALIFIEKLITFTFTSIISSPSTRLKTGTWDRPANPQHTSVQKFDEFKWKLSLSLCFCENKTDKNFITWHNALYCIHITS